VLGDRGIPCAAASRATAVGAIPAWQQQTAPPQGRLHGRGGHRVAVGAHQRRDFAMPDAGHSPGYFTAIGSNRSTFGAGHDHEVDPRCGAGRAAACRYVRECRPVERTSKPAVPLPLSGLRGHRRDLIHQRGAVLPDPQLHSGFRQRKLQLLVLHPQPPLLCGAGAPAAPLGTSSPAWSPLPGTSAFTSLPTSRSPRAAGQSRRRSSHRQHRQHHSHLVLDRDLQPP
jgi:hypothetical protein